MSEQPDGGHGYQFVYMGNLVRVHTECGEGVTRIVVEETPAQPVEQEAE